MINTREGRPVVDNVILIIHFVDGTTLEQPVPIDQEEDINQFMNWLRKPGRNRVYEWHTVNEQHIHMIRYDAIQSVEIEGYIEPEGRPSRWYERVIDWIRWRWFSG
jgi:hypothetical protein